MAANLSRRQLAIVANNDPDVIRTLEAILGAAGLTLPARITATETDIATNTAGIAANAASIATNTANIATNAADIAANEQAAASNRVLLWLSM